MRKRPRKSKVRIWWLRVCPLCGAVWRKKNRRVAATPPEGRLIQKHHRQDE